jgi:hypothetical protein
LYVQADAIAKGLNRNPLIPYAALGEAWLQTGFIQNAILLAHAIHQASCGDFTGLESGVASAQKNIISNHASFGAAGVMKEHQ